MIFLVKVNPTSGGWIDTYIIEAESKGAAVDKMKDFMACKNFHGLSISAKKLVLKLPFLVVEG